MRIAAMKGAVVVGVLMLAPAMVYAGNAQKGKTIFDQTCATCHGAMGKGDGAAAAALNPKPRDLSNKAYMSKLKDADIAKILKGGGPAVGKSPLMPPYAGSDADIQDLIAYIRTLAK